MTWLLSKGWAILVHSAAGHCAVWVQRTRQMSSVAWLPCACISLCSWPGAPGHRRVGHPAFPFLPPPSAGAVHGEGQQHPAQDPGLQRRKGEEKGAILQTSGLRSPLEAEFMPALHPGHCDPVKCCLYLKKEASFTNSHNGPCGGANTHPLKSTTLPVSRPRVKIKMVFSLGNPPALSGPKLQ